MHTHRIEGRSVDLQWEVMSRSPARGQFSVVMQVSQSWSQFRRYGQDVRGVIAKQPSKCVSCRVLLSFVGLARK